MGETVCRHDGGWLGSGSHRRVRLERDDHADAPTDIKLKRAEGVLETTWGAAAPRRYDAKRLRRECGCAGCDDEGAGVRTLNVDSVADIIGITHIVVVGNYAIEFSFPDGRDTDV